MTKQEYLTELDSHLMTLSDNERVLAVNFYTEYFEDAGAENEQAVMDELGKPFQLAKSIICEQSAYSKSQVYMKYRESNPLDNQNIYVSMKKESTPYTPATYSGKFSNSEDSTFSVNNDFVTSGVGEPDIIPSGSITNDEANAESKYRIKFDKVEAKPIEEIKPAFESGTYTENAPNYDLSYKNKSPYTNVKTSSDGNTAVKIILLLLFAIFIFFPVILPILFAIAGVMLAGVAAVLGGVVLVIVGIVRFFSGPLTGVATACTGLICIGGGLLAFTLSLLFFGKAVPWMVKGISKILKKI